MAHQASTNQHRRHHDVTIPTTPQQPTSTKGVPALPMMPPAPRAGQSTTAPTTQAQPFRDYDKVCTANDKSPRGTPAIIGFLGDPTLPHMQLPPLLSVEVASCGADRDAHDNTNHTTTTTTSSSSNNSNNNNNNSNNNNDDDNSDRAPVMMLKTVERPPRPRRAPSTAMATTNGTPSHHSTTPSSDDFGNSGTSNPTCSSCDRPTPSSSDTDVERRHTQTSATNVDACDRCVAAEHELARLRSEVQYLTTLWACQSCDTTPRRSHRRHRHQR
ncbi:hypothetical protein PTSG_13244 [Salpingoeca rosetta]|uniref:Uncharacterized protein n=1 Tax=Salpingoeca rosetta (strain ATCC 50818 / BSB-021) TaxID=946362 RepID=F2U7U0_SALR5|nr:uncharacterized protein PTSG_13244 [Salpingoeca rosetta]EGD72845.1 hypothetical protein PTSG_13244 [Salpingoeca rosetta]|eukprot:XP_004994668.1 hypothetical protein PTSG_13244 [Salpingoeca rosetta]